MDKTEALVKIHVVMDQVKHACPKSKRVDLLNKLQFYYDLVINYKTPENFYKYIVRESHNLINQARDESNF